MSITGTRRFRQSRTPSISPGHRRRRSLFVEGLENRLLLATVNWKSTSSGNWGDAANWSTGQVPGPSDDVVIDVNGASPTVTIDSTTQAAVNSIASSDPLAISGGSLSVSANSTISGGLAMTAGASLTASGSAISLTVTGTTTVSGSSLYAQAGATLGLSELTTYDNSIAGETFLESSGAGSVLDLPHLATLGDLQANLEIDALAREGRSSHPLAWPRSTIPPRSNRTSLAVVADGLATEIDLSGLTAFNCQAGSLTVTNDATVLDGELASLNGVAVALDGTGTMAIGQWASLAGGSMTITGGSSTFSSLSDFDDSSLSVSAGGSLSLPAVTSLAGPTAFSTLEAMGSGAVLSLPALASLGQFQYGLAIEANDGGQTLLPSLTSIDNTSAQVIQAASYGSGSTIDLSGLTTVTAAKDPVLFSVSSSAAILDGHLTSLSNVNVTCDGTGTLATSQWTSFTGSTLDLTGGALSLAGLTSADNASFVLSGSATLTLSAAADFVNSGASATLSDAAAIDIGTTVVGLPAPGNGVTISMPQTPAGLTIVLSPSGTYSGGTTINISSGDTITVADGMFTGGVVVNVAQGATVELSGVDELTGSSYTGGVAFNVAQGATVDLNGNFGGTLTGSGGGTVQLAEGEFIRPVIGGATLDFSGSMFQWTGGVMGLSAGDVTNRGTVNLSSSYESFISGDGTFHDDGSIIQTGTGNLELGDLGSGFTTLAVDAGGQYLLESQSGVVPHMLFNCAIDNAGTIRKTAGVGQTSLWIAGPLDNTGIIEIDSGSLFLNARNQLPRSPATLDRRHVECGERNDPGIARQHQHHRQRGEHLPGRSGCDDHRHRRSEFEQRKFQSHRRSWLQNVWRLHQQRQPHRRREQYIDSNR